MYSQFRPCVACFVTLTVITGVIYPAIVTGVARTAFPRQASGSLIEHDGKTVGSALIGQPFDAPNYFWSRPSATPPVAYNAAASSGSNVGPTNADLITSVKSRIAALRTADPGNAAPVPVDLVTASASGLDPHISLAAARYQVARVSRARTVSPDQVQQLVDLHTESRTLGVLGEPVVNVLELNLALDGLSGDHAAGRSAVPAPTAHR